MAAASQLSAEGSNMQQTSANLGERVAGLEEGYKHVATKADLEKLKADLTWRIVIAISIMTAIFVAVVRLG